MKSAWKADFTYFSRAENKVRFGDYFSKSKWIKSSLVTRRHFGDREKPEAGAISFVFNKAFSGDSVD
jgi:hypothetical protein